MTIKVARFVSIIGHPLITVPLIVVMSLFYYVDFNNALLVSILTIGGIIVPLTIKMYRNTKTGTYTNFDVSNQTERKSWYYFVLGLLATIVIILFLTDQPHALRSGFLLAALLLLTSQVVNYFIKSSLHVSLNIFLSFLIAPLNFIIAFCFFFFVLIIAWSRITLHRHTIREVSVGGVIGLIFGFLLYRTIYSVK